MKQAYQSWLDEQKMRLQKEIEVLEQEGRQDEANLHKVRLNIVNVFETVAHADAIAVRGDEALFAQRYGARFDSITAPWKKRLEQAKHYGDTITLTVEETKLDMAEQIRQAFWRG